jgi:hypothetical protein
MRAPSLLCWTILWILVQTCFGGPVYNTAQPFSFLISLANSSQQLCQGQASSSDSICAPFIAFPSNTCVQRYDDLVPPDYNLSLVVYSDPTRVLEVLGDSNFQAQSELDEFIFPRNVNVSGIAMVISGDEYYGMYPEDIAELAGKRGLKL